MPHENPLPMMAVEQVIASAAVKLYRVRDAVETLIAELRRVEETLAHFIAAAPPVKPVVPPRDRPDVRR